MAESELNDKISSLTFRELQPEDFSKVARLERECFVFPWGEEGMRKTFLNPSFRGLGGFLGDRLLCYSLLAFVPPEMELLNIAVSHDARKKGIGGRILDFTLQWARKKAIQTVYLESRASNTAALALYAKFDFKQVGLRKGYYQDTGEDALLLELHLE